jgi:Ricin-type beta-trefoil lectin domain
MAVLTVLTLLGALQVSTSPALARGPGLGPVTFQVSAGQYMCLDAAADQMRNGGKVQLWTCNGQPQQIWYVEDLGVMRNGRNSNFCLEAHGEQIRDGGTVQLWTCNYASWQRWYEGYSLAWQNGKNRSLCLDAKAQEIRDGGRIQLWTCNGQRQQRWIPIEAF